MNVLSTSTVVANRADHPRLAGMTWAHLLNDGAANYLPGVLPAILVSMNLSVSYAGVFMAALMIGQAAQPLVGLVADRIGGRAFVLAGLAGTSLGGALVGLMPNQWALLGVLVAIGLCNALFHPQALAGVRSIGGAHHGTSMSIFLIGGELGRGAWPLVTSWLVTVQGLDALWMLAIPTVLTLPLLWRWAPVMTPRHKDAAPLRWRTHAGPLSCLVAFASLRSLMIYSIVTFMPLLWQQQGGSLTGGASVISVLLLVGIIGNLGGGRLADHVGCRPVLIGAMVAAVLLLAAFIGSKGALSWLLLGLLGMALFATIPLTVLTGQNLLPENRSFGSGLALGLANALGALGVTVLGPVAAVWGTQTVLWVAVASGIVAAMLAIAIPERQNKSA